MKRKRKGKRGHDGMKRRVWEMRRRKEKKEEWEGKRMGGEDPLDLLPGKNFLATSL